MEKKAIKINFSGFWDSLDKENNFITESLRHEFEPVIDDHPDYLFYSVFSDEYINYPDDTVRIFFSGENQIPDFNLCDYAMGFDWIEFGDRYERMPLYLFYPGTSQMSVDRGGMMKNPLRRDEFCSFVCSNAEGDSKRIELFHELLKLQKVDSGGKFENNVGGPVQDKILFESTHRFSICFENASYPGYTTEKILQSFAAGTIPIYRGDPEICRVFNPKAFVNANEYEDMEELARYIVDFDRDEESIISMLKEDPFNPRWSIKEQRERAGEFIRSIFRQDKEKAFRRNRTFWGRNYERFFKRYLNVNMKLRRFKKFINCQ